jgi:hypothetical protein
MVDSKAKKFIAPYLVPAYVMADWGKTDPEAKKAAEQKLQTEWRKWMGEHSKVIPLTEAGRKTNRVTANGALDAKNDIMLYSVVEGESHEAAAKAFENHPHLQNSAVIYRSDGSQVDRRNLASRRLDTPQPIGPAPVPVCEGLRSPEAPGHSSSSASGRAFSPGMT